METGYISRFFFLSRFAAAEKNFFLTVCPLHARAFILQITFAVSQQQQRMSKKRHRGRREIHKNVLKNIAEFSPMLVRRWRREKKRQ